MSSVSEGKGKRKRHNRPQTEYDHNMAGLQWSAKSQLQGDPVYLEERHANAVSEQMLETASFRGWQLFAFAIMRNHIHLVVEAPGDPDPAGLLRDFKSYASRRLNRDFGKPISRRWWTESGSRRILKDEQAIRSAVIYVLSQEHPLLLWPIESQTNPSG